MCSLFKTPLKTHQVEPLWVGVSWYSAYREQFGNMSKLQRDRLVFAVVLLLNIYPKVYLHTGKNDDFQGYLLQ